MVARTVSVGSPEVTAKIMILEEWTQIPLGFFEIAGKSGDAPLRTIVMGETSVRKNLLPAEPVSWPPLQDGPLEGNVTTHFVIDRGGQVRDIGIIVSENPAIQDAAFSGRWCSGAGHDPIHHAIQDGAAAGDGVV